jgi:hypothetical protein
MKNVKINLDRPTIDSKSIQANKDFNGLVKNHAIMSKPFYKSTWFVGTTGIASVGLVVGGIVAFTDDTPQSSQELITNFDAPPEMTVPDNQLIQLNPNPKQSTQDLVKETFAYADYINNSNTIDDNNSTLENSENQEALDQIDQETNTVQSETVDLVHEEKHNLNDVVDFSPRINGKLNGSISKEELFDNKGITTESDVNVIHFELHLIDGLGGKVFEEESNQLNEEMKAALKKIHSGETIYFENIKGKTEEGDIVRLNPLRYVLMN